MYATHDYLPPGQVDYAYVNVTRDEVVIFTNLMAFKIAEFTTDFKRYSAQ